MNNTEHFPLFRIFLCAFVVAMTSACMVQRACAQVPEPLVLHIGWDGADYRLVKQMLDGGELPNLAALVQQGSFQQLEIVEVTKTKPSWATQLSGLPWYAHGSRDNAHFRPIPRGWTIFERLGSLGIPSAYVVGKCKNQKKHLCAGIDAVKHRGFPFKHVRKSVVYFIADADLSKQQITNHCLAGIQAVTASGAGGSGYVFCHYQWPDKTGHAHGGNSPEYDQDLRDLDAELGIVIASIPLASVIILTSDHGFERAGDPSEREIFSPPLSKRSQAQPFGFSHVWQSRAILGSSIPLLSPATGRDIAKTIYALLGVSPPEPLPEGRSLLP